MADMAAKIRVIAILPEHNMIMTQDIHHLNDPKNITCTHADSDHTPKTIGLPVSNF